MGISDLWNHFNHEWDELQLHELSGKTIAIDGHVWLYESMRETMHNSNSRAFLSQFYRRCLNLLHAGVHPYVLFDECENEPAPVVKTDDSPSVSQVVCWERNARPSKLNPSSRGRYGRSCIEKHHVYSVLELLDAMGIRYYKSNAVDTEAAASYLEEQGQVDGYLSIDLEYFLYGGQTLYWVYFEEQSLQLAPTVRRLRAESIFKSHGLNRSRFVALALLVGCDYMDKKISGVGMVSALEAVAEFSVHEDDHPCTILERFCAYCNADLPQRKTDTQRRKNLRATYFTHCNLVQFNPGSEELALIVDAYMWPSLEDLPYLEARTVGRINQRRIKDLLTPASPSTDGSETMSESSLEASDSRPKMAAVCRRGERRRMCEVVRLCSSGEGVKWSKREWQAILALKGNTTLAFNQSVEAAGPSTSGVGAKRRGAELHLAAITKRAHV